MKYLKGLNETIYKTVSSTIYKLEHDSNCIKGNSGEDCHRLYMITAKTQIEIATFRNIYEAVEMINFLEGVI